MDTDVFLAWLAAAAAAIEANRDHLTQLDAAIGDADHGTNLARGFAAVTAAIEGAAPRPATPGALLTLTGSTLISKVGGASGPLYGVAFRRAGKALGAAATVDLPGLEQALEAALAGVQQLGAAREGDKTMVDALAPATRAFGKAIAEGAAAAAALSALAEAAAAGAAATVSMQARKGRASYLGPRSVGHEDPGAASTALILAALRDAAAGAGRCQGRGCRAMTVFRGTPVSDGVAAGELYLPDAARTDASRPGGGAGLQGGGARADDVPAAFAAVAAERAGLAAQLRASGRDGEAGIVEVGALIAADSGAGPPPRRPRCWRAPAAEVRRARRRGSPGRDPRGPSRPGPGAARERRTAGRGGGHRHGCAGAMPRPPRTARSSWSAARWTRRT